MTELMTRLEATEKHQQLKSLHSVARALLLEMRDRKGYLALGFKSFDEYGEKEWGYTRTYINRLATAELTQQSLCVPIGTELPESQLRALAKISEEDRNAIYQEAKAKAEEAGKILTALAISEAATKHRESLQIAQQARDMADSSYKELSNKFDYFVEQNVKESLPKLVAEKQQEMQKSLDGVVKGLEQDYQAKIDSQKDIIAKLKNDLVTTSANESVEKLKAELDQAKEQLKELSSNNNGQVKISYTELINKARFDMVNELLDYLVAYKHKQSSSCYMPDGTLYPVIDFHENTRNLMLKTANELVKLAEGLRFTANYRSPVLFDEVDTCYKNLNGFFKKWKTFQQKNKSAGNDFNWWNSRLKESDSSKEIDTSLFLKIWERYQFEICAVN